MPKLSLASVLSTSVCFVCFAVLRCSMVSVFSFSTHCWGLWASATTSSTWLRVLIKCCQRRRWTWSSISFCLAVQIWKNNNPLLPFMPPLLRPWQPQSPNSLSLIRYVVNVSSISRKNPWKKRWKKWETEMLAKNWEESACGAKLYQSCQLSSVTAAWVIADISADMREFNSCLPQKVANMPKTCNVHWVSKFLL